MPLKISTTSTDTQVESLLASQASELEKGSNVSEELQNLQEYLSAKNKGGVLAIRTTSSGQKEMYRMHWYHRLWFCKTGSEQQKEAVSYVQGLLAKRDKQSAPVSQALADFVSPPSFTYKDLATRLSDTTTSTSLLTTLTSESLLSSQEITANDSTEFLKSHGISMGRQIGQGGQGRIYAITYQGNKDDYLYKVEKEKIAPDPINDLDNIGFGGNKIHRISGDIAAARCRLPNTIEAVGFFLKIVTNPGQNEKTGLPEQIKYHYLPNKSPEQIKEDALALHQKYPSAKFFLHSQIMKKASGKDLAALSRDGELDTDPKSKPFKNIVHGIYSFLAAARPRNFVHRDIKPGNLVFDKATGRLTVIDPTSGRHLANRNKALARASNSLYTRPTMDDPRRSSASFVSRDTMGGTNGAIFRSTVPPIIQGAGQADTQAQAEGIDSRPSEGRPSNRDTMSGIIGTTIYYANPEAATPVGQLEEKEYGAEFDCFSTAMTLLTLINKDDFSKYTREQFRNETVPELDMNRLAQPSDAESKIYLDKYLDWIKDSSTGTSETAKILEANPDFKTCLQLLFEASAGGDAGEKAFAKLAIDPYMVSCAAASLQTTATA